jgi:hypothetical protein
VAASAAAGSLARVVEVVGVGTLDLLALRIFFDKVKVNVVQIHLSWLAANVVSDRAGTGSFCDGAFPTATRIVKLALSRDHQTSFQETHIAQE